MTSRERMNRAMRPRSGQLPDRVPVMCQLSLGHYFLHAAGLRPVDIWHDSPAFGDALPGAAARYGFDGILVNLPGRIRTGAARSRRSSGEAGTRVLRWANGAVTTAPPDDNPHVRTPGRDGAPGAHGAPAVDPGTGCTTSSRTGCSARR